jgi:hypothetical protein
METVAEALQSEYLIGKHSIVHKFLKLDAPPIDDRTVQQPVIGRMNSGPMGSPNRHPIPSVALLDCRYATSHLGMDPRLHLDRQGFHRVAAVWSLAASTNLDPPAGEDSSKPTTERSKWPSYFSPSMYCL